MLEMNNENISEENKIVKHWYLNLILGIILTLVALWVFCNPEITYNSLAIVFSITLLLTGVLEIISSIQYKNLLHGWRWSLATGILNLLVVIKVILKPQISSEALILIMGFVFLYHSVKLIAWSTELKNYEARNLGWVLFGSFAGVMLSFLLVWNRTFHQLTLLFFTSFALLMIGISEIYFSFVLRKVKYKSISEDKMKDSN
jgi:uncharacterized membrane protein HdeD (DUF308 family)